MPTTDDLPPPRILANGVEVPSRLQVNAMSISEWHRRTQWNSLYKDLAKDQLPNIARSMGYTEEQIEREFGHAKPSQPSK